MVSYLRAFPSKPCKHFSPSPYMPHVPPTSSSLIYSVKNMPHWHHECFKNLTATEVGPVVGIHRTMYEGVSKSFRTESITKYKPTTTNTRWEAAQRFMVAKVTRLTHRIAIQLHLMVESCTICSSRSRRPVRKLLDTPSYAQLIQDAATVVAVSYYFYQKG
jgi:hypothetical protein